MTKPKESENRLIRLCFQLRYIEPPIWRRLLIPGNVTLWHLHAAIQLLMGWEDYHLHSFTIKNRVYEPPEVEPFSPVEGLPPKDDTTVAVGKVLTRKGQTLYYNYDFGDNWEIDGVVEEILPADPTVTKPVCLGGQRAGPPEDCGGVYDYQAMVDALRDPDSAEANELPWSLDEDFDPEAFDPETATRDMAERWPAGAPRWRIDEGEGDDPQ